MTFEPQYNPETCVHAGELRERGYDIPESIPDCAWIPRDAMVPTEDFNVEKDHSDDKLFHFSVGVVFTQPFRWVEGKFVQQNQCSHCGTSDKKVIPDADAFDFYCDECGHKLARGEEEEDG